MANTFTGLYFLDDLETIRDLHGTVTNTLPVRHSKHRNRSLVSIQVPLCHLLQLHLLTCLLSSTTA